MRSFKKPNFRVHQLLDICPANAIKSEGDFVSIDPGICGGCGFCGSVCPSNAIQTDYPPLEFILTQTKNS